MPHYSARAITALAIPLLTLLAPLASRGADVELKDGKRFSAVKVTFYTDTNQFQINDGRTTLRYPAAMIRSLIVDESGLANQTSGLKADLKQAQDSGAQAKQQLDQALLRNRDLQKSYDLLAAEKSALEKGANQSGEIQRLTGEVQTLRERNLFLQGRLTSQTATQVVPSSPEKPVVGPVKWKPAREKGFVEIQGTCTNTGKTAYSDAIVEIWVKDEKGDLVANAASEISNFAPGEKRNFAADVEVDPPKVARVEAVIGDLFAR